MKSIRVSCMDSGTGESEVFDAEVATDLVNMAKTIKAQIVSVYHAHLAKSGDVVRQSVLLYSLTLLENVDESLFRAGR